jgi:hypothetical protein
VSDDYLPPGPRDLPPVMTGPPRVAPAGNGTGGDEVLDFTIRRRPVRFRIDDDLFQAAAALPAGVAFEFAELASGLQAQAEGDRDRVAEAKAAMGLFEKILYPESYQRFRQRMFSIEEPIDPGQLFMVVSGLMSRYGLRPTEPSADSSAGREPPADGTNSTAAPPPPVSTSTSSPSTDSATTPTPPSSPG